jgi:dsRNA-specific ribonuclease
MRRFSKALEDHEELRMLDDWWYDEQVYLHQVFQKVTAAASNDLISLDDPDAISHKLETLVNTLQGCNPSNLTGIIFVEQRATAATLASFLSTHPHTSKLYKVGRFVGMSTNTRRKSKVADLAEPRIQQQDLDGFRAGERNLIVSTNALEEGIDVSKCNVVVCFDEPKNLKSFIQRRGRAREQSSRYIIMVPDSQAIRRNWETLEEEMRRACSDDERRIRAAMEHENVKETTDRSFRIPSTGALLTHDNAVAHLHHFCESIVQESRYIDSRPSFTFEKGPNGLTVAKVVLPVSVDASFRTAQSTLPWRTEQAAAKDAAFACCLQLLQSKLLNDHLLPGDAKKSHSEPTHRFPPVLEVKKTWDPWLQIAQNWASNPELSTHWYKYRFKLQDVDGGETLELLFPGKTETLRPMVLHLNGNRAILESEFLDHVELSVEELSSYQRSTITILRSIFGEKVSDTKSGHMVLLGPCDVSDAVHRMSWSIEMNSSRLAKEIEEGWSFTPSQQQLVRAKSKPSKPWLLQGFATDVDGNAVCQAGGFSKQRDLLHPPQAKEEAGDKSIVEIPVEDCIVDNLPAIFAKFALCMPTICFKWTTSMVATSLQEKCLPDLKFHDHALLHTAITSSGALDVVSYERFEFLGDCLLKFCTSLSLSAQHPQWPEAYLTEEKGRIVSNTSLAQAAIKLGLEQHIIYTAPAVAKWRPKYESNYNSESTPGMKRLSSKTVADVVEALIGAVYLDSDRDLTRAEAAIHLLLRDETWVSFSDATELLYRHTPQHDTSADSLSKVSQLIGHSFDKPLLLREALTHPSYMPPMSSQEYELSYQRLEFLGDAILDLIIVRKLFELGKGLKHSQLHSLRTTVANRHILAFLCMELSVVEERYAIAMSPDGVNTEPARATVGIPLWAFMRKGSAEVTQAQKKAAHTHADLREYIWTALRTGRRYPWALLECGVPKFFSDIIESILGAIYLDTHGSIEKCTSFLERLGLLDLLQRLIQESVDVLHPKERIGIAAKSKKVKYMRQDTRYSIQFGDDTYETQAETETRAATEVLKQLGVYEALDGETKIQRC